MKLGVLASGTLGFQILQKISTSYCIRFVMTDTNSTEIISYCENSNLSVFVGNPRTESAILFFKRIEIDVLISVNYLFLIEKELIKHPSKLAFNIHGSLLPKYRGRTPHVWAIINNEIETGVTAHLIDEGCDTGDIIHQKKIIIDYNDTGAIILEKFSQLYFPLIQMVLSQISNNSLNIFKQDSRKATYFGRRKANDGEINWEWQKERIRNWVRAQAYPYPGAFTFVDNQKLVIDKVDFFDYNYNSEMPNGIVLKLVPLLVKTPNGVVMLSKIRNQVQGLKEGILLK